MANQGEEKNDVICGGCVSIRDLRNSGRRKDGGVVLAEAVATVCGRSLPLALWSDGKRSVVEITVPAGSSLSEQAINRIRLPLSMALAMAQWSVGKFEVVTKEAAK